MENRRLADILDPAALGGSLCDPKVDLHTLMRMSKGSQEERSM